MNIIIEIDLTHNSIVTYPLSKEMASRCLGGFGFNIQYLYSFYCQENNNKPDPLGADNILIFSSGLLSGTPMPVSSRLHINAVSPLSGLIGSSNVGGSFGYFMAKLGICSLIIKGKAAHPIYLHLHQECITINDANEIWGRDTEDTISLLQKDTNDPHIEALLIGPAGENLVRYSCITTGTDHAAGRTGLGAVMGSKFIKAICVSSKKQLGLADKQKTGPAFYFEKPRADTCALDLKTNETSEIDRKNLIKEYLEAIKSNSSRFQDYAKWGSAGDILELSKFGLLSTKNYTTNIFSNPKQIDGRGLHPLVTKKRSCLGCPVGCKAEIKLKDGKYQGFTGGRPEYETIISLGPLCGLSDPHAVVYLSNLCNSLGLDTISTGSAIAFAMDLYDRNIISTTDTGGLPLKWGDAVIMETLINLIARRQGFGDILAEGVAKAAEIIGQGSERYAFHVKGVEIYGADPRGIMGTALSYAISLRGGDFTSVYPVPEFRFSEQRAEQIFGTAEAVNLRSTQGKGALIRYSMIASAVMDSIGICKVPALSIAGNFDLDKETVLVNTLTGLSLAQQDMTTIGLRIINMEKLLNLYFGATCENDQLPAKFKQEAIKEGPAKGAFVDVTSMVQDFYNTMGWDSKGTPKPETLKNIGLGLDNQYKNKNK